MFDHIHNNDNHNPFLIEEGEGYYIHIGGLQIRVAIIAIIGYIIFCFICLLIVWVFFKEKSGIEQLKAAPNIDPTNYDPSAFADVQIKMETQIDLGQQFRDQRARTVAKMAELEPEYEISSSDSDMFSDDNDDDIFNKINLANNPLSASYNQTNIQSAMQQVQINHSTMSMDNTVNINASSYQGGAIKLEDLNSVQEYNPYQLQVSSAEPQFTKKKSTKVSLRINNDQNYHKIKEEENIDFGQGSRLVPMNVSSQKKASVTVTVSVQEDDHSSCACIFKYINKMSLYTPILFHFWDMATDLAVLCDWIPQANWNDPFATSAPNNELLPNTFWFIIGSLTAMITYRSVSGYRYALRFSKFGGFLQFLDIMLFFEIYASVNSKKHKSTVQLRWIRKMESVLESWPQAFIQLVYVLTVNSSDNLSLIVQISLLFSILSITSSVVRSDDWKVKVESGANKICPPNWRFFLRATFRLFEITSRLTVIALLSQISNYGILIVVAVLIVEIIFYSIMYKDGFLGMDLGNIIEMLIVHPNISLRISDEELKYKTESIIGWISRTLCCWTQIGGFANLCCLSSDRRKERVDRGSCTSICIHKNVVSVHFVHRFIESSFELIIIVLSKYFEYNNFNFLYKQSFTQTMFIIAAVAVFLTPILFRISFGWFIVGGAGQSIEMNVFGFLHAAHAEDDLTQFIRFIFRVRSSVNSKNKFGRTPLMESVLLKNYKLVKFLVSLTDIINLSETDTDNSNKSSTDTNNGINNKTIIHYAAQLGDSKIMKLILDAKKEQDSKYFNSNNVRKKKLNKYNENMQQLEIDAGYGKYNKTALIITSEEGYSECTKLLLEYGANVNFQDKLGRTSLHYAIFGQSASYKDDNDDIKDDNQTDNGKQQQYTSVILILLDNYPDLALCDSSRKWTPLFQAVGGGNKNIVNFLYQASLASSNQSSAANLLDNIDENGESLLHIAVRYNRHNVLKYLITKTNRIWNLSHKNRKGETPLKLAIYGKYILCLKYLINSGYYNNSDKQKDLMKGVLLAVKINAPDIVNILIREYNVNPNFTDNTKMTPLRWAAFNGYKSVIKELLIGGARDDVDEYGQNVIFYAAKNGNINILELLRKANADFCVINYEGLTAIDKAKNKETVEFIKKVRSVQLQQH